jgi:hypothetical protein
MAKISRAISIRQPYVELILRGIKKWEYRGPDTRIRERVYLYAAQKPGENPADWRKIKSQPGGLPTGKIVGTVEIGGTRQLPDGSHAYALCNPKRLSKYRTPINQPQPCFWLPKFRS